MNQPDIILSRRDFRRLDTLLGGAVIDRIGKVGEFLLDELSRARVLPDQDVPANVVTMHATVRFRDDESGRISTARLVYPEEARQQPGGISVLTPVGAALLGVSAGDSISYETPDGRVKSLTVIEVTHEDETANALETDAADRDG